jgi:hypothetical protein
MAGGPEFGKRRPQRLPDMQPAAAPKRSRHVALLVMGTFAVGGSAYTLMGRENCQPAPPAAAGVAAPPQSACKSRGPSYGGGIRSSHFSFFGGGSSGGSDSASSGVSRGGFGAFASAFGFGRS